MDDKSDVDRKNDGRLLTPLLIMALIIVVGILLSAFAGHASAAL